RLFQCSHIWLGILAAAASARIVWPHERFAQWIVAGPPVIVPAPARGRARGRKGFTLKIFSFGGQGRPRLWGVVGGEVIGLHAVDPGAPNDLGDWLSKHDGDLKPLADLAKRAPASARKPLAGLTYRLPVSRPGKIICLGLNYLEHVKEGAQRDNIPQFPTIFM